MNTPHKHHVTRIVATFLLLSLAATIAQAQRIQPDHLTYLGAFRLPLEGSQSNWGYSGHAMTYYPSGDPSGSADGHPGSLFGIGHAWHMMISEITIPAPVISTTKNPDELNYARTLQPFTDVRSGVDSIHVFEEIVRVGMEYLPARGEQTSDKLHFAWGAHFQEDEQNVASHMWSEMDFSGRAGPWRVSGASLYSVNDYMFAIPEEWASTHTQGRQLATGRYRDGGWSGMGPCLYAIAPWQHGNPPLSGAVLQSTPLLQYSTTYYEDPDDYRMTGYHNSDEWTGASWLAAGGNQAVVFVGTKGVGDSAWYGDPMGPCLDCEDRGRWSDAFEGQIIFYDPSDLARVADGEIDPWQPQPYAVLRIDEHLFGVDSSKQKYHLGASAYDSEHRLFYVFEFLADEDQSLVHVWHVESMPTRLNNTRTPERFNLLPGYPNPFRASTTLRYTLTSRASVTLTVYDQLGRTTERVVDGISQKAGEYSIGYNHLNRPPGVYFVRLTAGGLSRLQKLVVLR